jgi:nucleoside-diphosphate-sugar epimerase
MITILGVGGVIANEVVKLLSAREHLFRLVARNARPVPGATEVISADLSDKDQTVRAVAGSSVVYLLVGLKYDHKLWAEMWPRIMANTIEACKRAGARLIFFDNVYMYGKVSVTMTEEMPLNPCSKKGEVRAKIASAKRAKESKRAVRPAAINNTPTSRSEEIPSSGASTCQRQIRQGT